MNTTLVSFTVLGVVTAFLVGSQPQSQSATNQAVAAPRAITSYQDMRGALYNKSPKEKVQILEIRFGLTKDLDFCTAYLRAIDFNGNPYVIDQKSLCAKVFADVNGLRGFYQTFGKKRLWVEQMTLAVGPDGGYFPSFISAMDTESSATQLLPLSYQWTNPTCKWVPLDICSTQGTCAGTCPPIASPAPCPCTGGGGQCQITHTFTCNLNGSCPGDKQCIESGPFCGCVG